MAARRCCCRDFGRIVQGKIVFLRIVYLGSGDIGLPTLHALLHARAEGRHELAAVITQPDRPVGRHQTLTAGPIKAAALAAGVPVLSTLR